MKLLKIEQNGSISLVVDSNNYQSIPSGFIVVDSDLDDMVIINERFMKDGLLKERVPQPTSNHIWDLATESWLLDLTRLRQYNSRLINQACSNAMVSGFVSCALGEPYHYPSKTLDQQNLAASVLASYDPENAPDWTTPFWCSDSSGDWDFRSHTAAQIREVGRDAKASILAYQYKNESLQNAISAAETAEQIAAITW